MSNLWRFKNRIMKIGRKTIHAVNELPTKYKSWQELFDEIVECNPNELKKETTFLVQYKRKWYAIYKRVLIEKYLEALDNIAPEKLNIVIH